MCALSMFETEAAARAKFAKLTRGRKLLAKLIGDHLGKVSLDETHGRRTPSSEGGHFDLHEFEGADLVAATQIIGTLP